MNSSIIIIILSICYFFLSLYCYFYQYIVQLTFFHTVSNLDVPEDGCDQVDSDAFWENVGFALVVRGFFHTGWFIKSLHYVVIHV